MHQQAAWLPFANLRKIFGEGGVLVLDYCRAGCKSMKRVCVMGFCWMVSVKRSLFTYMQIESFLADGTGLQHASMSCRIRGCVCESSSHILNDWYTRYPCASVNPWRLCMKFDEAVPAAVLRLRNERSFGIKSDILKLGPNRLAPTSCVVTFCKS